MLGWVGLDGCNGWVDGWMGGWMMDEVSSVDEVCSNFFFHYVIFVGGRCHPETPFALV